MPSAKIVSAAHTTECTSLTRMATPGGSQTVESAARPPMTATMPTTSPTDSRPCSKLCKVCVKENCATHADKPERPASVKSNTHDPIVVASATMAAVAELSDIVAANSEIAPTNRP